MTTRLLGSAAVLFHHSTLQPEPARDHGAVSTRSEVSADVTTAVAFLAGLTLGSLLGGLLRGRRPKPEAIDRPQKPKTISRPQHSETHKLLLVTATFANLGFVEAIDPRSKKKYIIGRRESGYA